MFIMLAMSQVIVYLDNLNEEQRRVCEGCLASGQTYMGSVPMEVCKLAELENTLGKIPTYGEATRHGVNAGSIPEGCPNGYISLPSREIR